MQLLSYRDLNLVEGERLFIAGASGAIGTLVIQMAIAKGVQVASSASSNNQDYLKSLGVHLPVDYNNPEWKDQIRNWAKLGVFTAH